MGWWEDFQDFHRSRWIQCLVQGPADPIGMYKEEVVMYNATVDVFNALYDTLDEFVADFNYEGDGVLWLDLPSLRSLKIAEYNVQLGYYEVFDFRLSKLTKKTGNVTLFLFGMALNYVSEYLVPPQVDLSFLLGIVDITNVTLDNSTNLWWRNPITGVRTQNAGSNPYKLGHAMADVLVLTLILMIAGALLRFGVSGASASERFVQLATGIKTVQTAATNARIKSELDTVSDDVDSIQDDLVSVSDDVDTANNQLASVLSKLGGLQGDDVVAKLNQIIVALGLRLPPF